MTVIARIVLTPSLFILLSLAKSFLRGEEWWPVEERFKPKPPKLNAYSEFLQQQVKHYRSYSVLSPKLEFCRGSRAALLLPAT